MSSSSVIFLNIVTHFKSSCNEAAKATGLLRSQDTS